jgi:hypothetical protein
LAEYSGWRKKRLAFPSKSLFVEDAVVKRQLNSLTVDANLKGAQFVAASVVVVNKTRVATDVTRSTTIKATVGPADLDGPGTYGVWVNTPAGNSGDLGCSSGGAQRPDYFDREIDLIARCKTVLPVSGFPRSTAGCHFCQL